MPSLAKSKVSKVSKLKKVAKPLTARNGHKNGIKAAAAKPVKVSGKAGNLAEMANIGLPVPPGFTITTDVCTEFYTSSKKLPKGLDAEVRAAVGRMEKLVGAKLGDAANPLLVSVRSGARASMPGMMDTILNLGLNDKTAQGLAK